MNVLQLQCLYARAIFTFVTLRRGYPLRLHPRYELIEATVYSIPLEAYVIPIRGAD